jgi:hypothetical protein
MQENTVNMEEAHFVAQCSDKMLLPDFLNQRERARAWWLPRLICHEGISPMPGPDRGKAILHTIRLYLSAVNSIRCGVVRLVWVENAYIKGTFQKLVDFVK